MPKPQAKIGTMLDLLQKNPEATRADLAELEAATQPRRLPVIRASTLSERIRDKYYDLFESAARQPIGRLSDALGLSDLQGIANERATGGKLMMATAVPPPGAGTLATVAKEAQAARALTGGFYSRVDEAAKLLPSKGVKAESLINTLKKASGGVSAEELELRGLAEFAASKRGQVVTPADLSAHLKANPAPFPTVKTLGGPSSEDVLRQHGLRSSGIDYATDLYRISDGPDAIPLTVNELKQFPQEVMDAFEGVSTGGTRTTALEFSQYQVPGGENYRETLLTLPKGGTALSEAENQRFNYLQHRRTSGAFDMMRGPLKDELQALKDKLNPPAEFRSSHFNDPNIVAHTRSNERTSPTGERGTFLEEVQSDWHQQGKEKGYQDPSTVAAMREAEKNMTAARERRAAEYEKLSDMSDLLGNPNRDDAPFELVRQLLRWKEASKLKDEADDIYRAAARRTGGVPDAPFKENWPDLSLKQALIDEANRSPDPGFLGFTGGKTQASRYDLSKQVSEIEVRPVRMSGDSKGVTSGWRVTAKDPSGRNNAITEDISTLDELPDYIGKDAARTAQQQIESGGTAKLTGLDLQVGGEGMHEFYDKLLPKRLEKIMKPFGGTVEPFDVTPNRYTVGSGSIVDEPNTSWFSRLTPEMKARILKEGLPLMGLSGLTLGNLLGQDQKPVR